MYNNFQDMINMKITEEQHIDRFNEYNEDNEHGLGAKVLENLLKEKKTLGSIHYYNIYTSRKRHNE